MGVLFAATVVIVLLTINIQGLITTLPRLSPGGYGDWSHLGTVDLADPYASPFYRWAPPAIWAWRYLIEPLGFVVWAGLHVAAILLVRPWWLAGLALVSFPFWADLANGNALTFVAVSAHLAMRGSTGGTVAFIALSALMPRPIVVPGLLWLLWHRPWTRVAAVAAGVAALVLSLAVGELGTWVERLLMTSGVEAGGRYDIGPSALLGTWWLLIGIPLGAILLWRGRTGLAGLAIAPYWLSYYLLMPLADWPGPRELRDRGDDGD